ncbi:MAG: alanyl-tRNA editing protein [Candidatus Thorarchaeota archaeon]|jgi:misacylated tRNA(Ala) deacylase
MTEMLYMHDNYLREFEAIIVEVGDDYIVLDRTAFYPEGGGQVGDSGTISKDSELVHISVTKKKDGKVQHITQDPIPFQMGDSVKCKLEWESRHRCMRFHTAQHVLSRYLQLNYDLITVGNQISPDKSRADYSPLEHFDEDMKRKVEKGVNEIISKNIEVKLRFMPREEAIEFLGAKGYQVRYLEMVPKSVKEFRIILLGEYDAASCAGTHVANTSEIGGIQIGKTKNVGAGKRRIYFSLIDN